MGLTAEAGFFAIPSESYAWNGERRTSPAHRIWYSFRPASTAPESKPIAVFFNGGPGSATSTFLFSFNTGPFTLAPDRTGAAGIAANDSSWTQFANLLFIDAPGTGFSYPVAIEDGTKPALSIDLDRDAGSVLRVVLRFLHRHPGLQSNPVVIVGESYGGTRAALMLEQVLFYRSLATAETGYRDQAVYQEIVEHLAAVFPDRDATALSPDDVARQFGHQVLIQPFVAAEFQQARNTPDTSACRPDGDYGPDQCDEPPGWIDGQVRLVADRLVTVEVLRQMLGVDPTSIEWLHAAARAKAYGRGNGMAVPAPELEAALGALGSDDNYLLVFNPAVVFHADTTAPRTWTDPLIGEIFLSDVRYVHTFITHAAFDTNVWSPAIPPALADYTTILSSSVHDTGPRTGVARPGWIELSYLTPAATTREIRFPYYASSGHAVTVRQSAELLADVVAWYDSTKTEGAGSSGN